nr:FadR/GntR family transcriptional regulator [Allomuricauda sp.]
MKVQSDLLSIQIAENIEKQIRDRVYTIGEKLPTENEFCTQFSASRTAVREALKSLKARGLVEIKKGSGAYVAELSSEGALNPIHLYFEMSADTNLVYNTIKTRQAFEPEIANLAARNRTDEDLFKIEENLNLLIECSLDDVDGETIIDGDFHSLVAGAAQNPVIALIMNPIHNLIPKHKTLIYGKKDVVHRQEIRESVVRFHTRIYEAIKERDGKEAYYQMKEHLRRTELYSKHSN